MGEIVGNIKKITLSNGSTYAIFDQGALRLDSDGKTIITGNGAVDRIIVSGNLHITKIDEIPLADTKYQVLVQGANGEIQYEDIRIVLSNLGQLVSGWEETNGTLGLKYYAYSKPTSGN